MQKSLAIPLFISINIFQNIIGILRSKILAIVWGIAYVGILGQLITLFNLQSKIVSFSSEVALVSMLGKDSNKHKNSIILSAFLLVAVSNIIFLSLIFIFSKEISVYLLKSTAGNKYIIWLGLLGPLYSLNIFLESLYRADKNFRFLAKIKSVSLLLTIISIVPLTYYYGIWGIIISFNVWFISSIIFFLPAKINTFRFTVQDLKNLKFNFIPFLKICLSDITRNISILLSLMLLRIFVVQFLDIIQAGYFQAVWSISNYINILISGYAYYFFPVISSLEKNNELNREINSSFETLIHIVFPFFAFIFLLPELILYLLYSKDFIIAAEYLGWLTFGKLFETVYLFYITILVAQNRLKMFVSLEAIRGVLIVISPLLLIYFFGFAGCIYGVLISQIVSGFILFLIIIRNKVLKLNNSLINILTKITVGFLIIQFIPNGNIIYFILRLLIIIVLFYFTLKIDKYFKLFNLLKAKIIKI